MHSGDLPDVKATRQIFLPLQAPVGAALACESIAASLRELRGVRYAFVSAQTEMAWLIYDPLCFVLADAIAAVRALGYHVGPPERR